MRASAAALRASQQNTRRIAGDRAHHHEGDQADTQEPAAAVAGEKAESGNDALTASCVALARQKIEQHRVVSLRLFVKRHMAAVGKNGYFGVRQPLLHFQGAGGRQFIVLAAGDQARRAD
jgi:hypothetical protein